MKTSAGGLLACWRCATGEVHSEASDQGLAADSAAACGGCTAVRGATTTPQGALTPERHHHPSTTNLPIRIILAPRGTPTLTDLPWRWMVITTASDIGKVRLSTHTGADYTNIIPMRVAYNYKVKSVVKFCKLPSMDTFLEAPSYLRRRKGFGQCKWTLGDNVRRVYEAGTKILREVVSV